MPDPHYPSKDKQFFEDCILACPRVVPGSKITVGDTTSFVLDGTQALHRRFISFREIEPDSVCYEQATGLAARLGFMGKLLTWLEDNRDWKDGAYFVP